MRIVIFFLLGIFFIWRRKKYHIIISVSSLIPFHDPLKLNMSQMFFDGKELLSNHHLYLDDDQNVLVFAAQKSTGTGLHFFLSESFETPKNRLKRKYSEPLVMAS